MQRKTPYCLNCGQLLAEKDNYCPQCGQQNKDKRVAVKTLINDFLGDYFNFDSKLFRSIIPLLFKPGLLTKEFNEGKRVKYIPPLRMYFFISFVYFLTLSLTSEDSNKKQTKTTYHLGDTTKFSSSELSDDSSTTIQISTGTIKLNKKYQKLLKEIVQKNQSEDVLLDSLNIEKNTFTRLLAAQLIKLVNKKGEGFKDFLLSNISIMMFLLLPGFAFILSAIYYRHKMFYVEHLIFAFNFHSFVFLLLTLSVLISFLISSALKIVIALSCLYLFFALKNVYRQKFRKTLFKTILLIFSYNFCLCIFIIATIVVTFLIF